MGGGQNSGHDIGLKPDHTLIGSEEEKTESMNGYSNVNGRFEKSLD